MGLFDPVKARRWFAAGLMATLVVLYLLPRVGVPLPEGQSPSGWWLLFGALFLLPELLGRAPTPPDLSLIQELSELNTSLREENARLKTEAERFVREGDQARAKLDMELRAARLAYEELRKERPATSATNV